MCQLKPLWISTALWDRSREIGSREEIVNKEIETKMQLKLAKKKKIKLSGLEFWIQMNSNSIHQEES